MKINKIMMICAFIVAQTISADDIRDSFKLAEWGTIGLKSAANLVIDKSDKRYPTKAEKTAAKKKVERIADGLVGATRVAQKSVEFKNHLPTISEKARLLNDRLSCFDHLGQPQCSLEAMGCATEEICAAKILQALVELLDPIIKDLLGTIKKAQPGKDPEIDPGALLSLVLMIQKGPNREKYEAPLREYLKTLDVTMKFMRTVIYNLEPYELAVKQIAADTNMSPKEKTFLQDALNNEPIEIADQQPAQIDYTEVSEELA